MAWAPDYVTVAELRSYLRITDSVDDAEIGVAITAASRAVDHAAGRQFGVVSTAVERYYRAWYDRVRRNWTVAIDDLMTETGLVVSGLSSADRTYSTIARGRFDLEPRNAAADGKPWSAIVFVSGVGALNPREAGLRIAARWGWTAVPVAVEQAVLIQASRFFARRSSPYGIAGSPEAGSEVRLLARLDPDVAVALQGLRRIWAVADAG